MTSPDEQHAPADAALRALIELHRGLPRQGPGDGDFSRHLLALLPALPSSPRIADLGCGSGAAALLLAAHFNCPVRAVDLSRAFLDQLEAEAQRRDLAHLIHIEEADIGSLDWPDASLDLLWSEGAAYNLTFAGALRRWRPLLAAGGIAVVSELSWFTDAPPPSAREYWRNAYAHIGTEACNAQRAAAAGFDVLGIRRLPAQAWWDHYYDPLARRIEALKPSADAVMRAVMLESEAEMALFRHCADSYGYAFYLLRAV